ncbi:hypothetical protein ACKKBF_B31515 [Auxenochlorella protothecoides x Auxenochlorella symbiontica]
MQSVIQAAIEQQVLRAAEEMETALDAQLHAMDNLDPDDIEALRQRRVQEMKRLQQRKAEWAARGHGEVQEVEEKEFFKCARGEERLVAHFYRSSEPCRVMDMHLARLAPSHMETKFVRVAAEKAPFLTDRLKIWMLPTLAIVKSGKATEYVVGFNELGGSDDFPTSALEARLAAAGAISEDVHHNKAAGVQREGTERTVRRGGRQRTDSDEDSDFD